MKCCLNLWDSFMFEVRKSGQILCAHKPCFSMPGHNLVIANTWLQTVKVKTFCDLTK